MKGINYGRFISVYQSQDGGMYYNIGAPAKIVLDKSPSSEFDWLTLQGSSFLVPFIRFSLEVN